MRVRITSVLFALPCMLGLVHFAWAFCFVLPACMTTLPATSHAHSQGERERERERDAHSQGDLYSLARVAECGHDSGMKRRIEAVQPMCQAHTVIVQSVRHLLQGITGATTLPLQPEQRATCLKLLLAGHSALLLQKLSSMYTVHRRVHAHPVHPRAGHVTHTHVMSRNTYTNIHRHTHAPPLQQHTHLTCLHAALQALRRLQYRHHHRR